MPRKPSTPIPVVPARDRFDNLVCQYPRCKTVIRAFTGFQELQKMSAHVARKHGGRPWDMNTALEQRAYWEQGGKEPDEPDKLKRRLKV